MEKSIIEVKNISKKYLITRNKGYITFREMIVNSIKKPINKLKKKTNSISRKEDFWALKNITFDVTKGDVIGIIGRNVYSFH